MRIPAIDLFRGVSIALMVFFTLINRLGGDSLPDILLHNVPGSLHLGDFVLPMFLFASGMSLVFFHENRKKKKGMNYALDVVERCGKLALPWVFISLFSSGEFLGMDELMLNILLFIPALILVRFDEKIIAMAALAICVLYLSLYWTNALPDFTAHYLGGYPAAVFYLPVMLAGVIAGRRVERTESMLLPATITAALLVFLVPPWKMSASPSFMAISVLLSLATFYAVRNLRENHLEYLGMKPLRYWILMFVLLGIPLTYYMAFRGENALTGIGWPATLAISALCIPLLYVASRALDRLMAVLRIKFPA